MSSTMKVIAGKANVSITTVSNVINGNYAHVSPETVKKIQQLAKELDYAPNMSARSLVKSNSKIIGVVNYRNAPVAGFMHDPFQGAMLDAISKTLTKHGYYMMVNSVHSESELLMLLHLWSMDGLIISGSVTKEELTGLFAAQKPFVLIDSYLKEPNVMSVGLEDFRGGYIAAQYLIQRRHRHVAFASPEPISGGVIAERLRGFKAAFENAGLTVPPENIYYQDLTVADGILLGQKLSERNDVTAVVASADLLAAGILSGLQTRGVRVPDDMSIVGFDDIDICMLTNPHLTTIHQDPQVKGQLAAEMIVRCLTGRKLISSNIVLPVNLVERESVGSI